MHQIQRVAAPTTIWRWTPTEARAFAAVKEIVHKWWNTQRKSVDYSPNALPCNLCCDASLTGGSSVLSQGHDYLTTDVISFWSGKFNLAQQNYPVHELELLAIVESLKWFSHLLQGLRFCVYTDHKGLEWITTQKKLSPRKARWLEVFADFDFEIIHVPCEMNQLADVLSCMYSDEPWGIVHAASEYVTAEEEHTPSALILSMVSTPLYMGESIFLGAASAQRKAREAFRNARKVVLKVRDPSEQLVGECVPKISENFENSPKDPEIPPEAESELENIDAPTEDVNNISAADLDDELEPVNSLIANHRSCSQLLEDNTTATELLSEDPVSLTEVLNSGEPTLDIHNRIHGTIRKTPSLPKL